jgi:hypothetical protein
MPAILLLLLLRWGMATAPCEALLLLGCDDSPAATAAVSAAAADEKVEEGEGDPICADGCSSSGHSFKSHANTATWSPPGHAELEEAARPRKRKPALPSTQRCSPGVRG